MRPHEQIVDEAEPTRVADEVEDVNDDRSGSQGPERPQAESCPGRLQGRDEQDYHDVHGKKPDRNEGDLRSVADQLGAYAPGVLDGDDRHPSNKQRQQRPHQAA